MGLPGRRLILQGIGLIDTDAVNDFPSEACNDVKQVIDDLGIRAVFANLPIEGGVHVYGDGFDALTAFLAQGFRTRAS